MKNLEFLFDEFLEKKIPAYDMCGCSNCGWKGKAADCETKWENDGWEYPEYQIQLCPVCEDGGCIDDYWYSDELIAEIEQRNDRNKN